MNAKRTFSGAVTRIASITLALLMVFSMGVTLLTANAAGANYELTDADGFCIYCGKFTSADAKTAAKAAVEADPDLTGYFYTDADGEEVPISIANFEKLGTDCKGLIAFCEDCGKMIIDCSGTTYDCCEDDTHKIADPAGDIPTKGAYCTDCCPQCHLEKYTCPTCGKCTCPDDDCPICVDDDDAPLERCAGHTAPNDDPCDKKYRDCPVCGGTLCDRNHEHFKIVDGKKVAVDPCKCIRCAKCGDVIVYDSKNKKYINYCTEPGHFDETGTLYCADCCPKCSASPTNTDLVDITKDKGTYTIPVGDTAALTFKVTNTDKFDGGTHKVNADGITISDEDGLEYKGATVDTSGKDTVSVKGLKPGEYKVTIPIKLTKKNGANGGTENVSFKVNVYDPTKLPDDIKSDLTLKINDITDGKSYKPGDIHFGAEGSSKNEDVTVTPSNWVLTNTKDGKEVSKGEFTEKDGKLESDLKKLEKGSYTLTVKYNVKDGETGKTYVATKSIKFSVSKSSGGNSSVDTADNTKIYVTAFVVSLCVLTFTVIGMAAYLKRKNRTASAGHRSFR